METRFPSIPRRMVSLLMAVMMALCMVPSQALAELSTAGEEESLGTVYISISFDGKYIESDVDDTDMVLVPVSLDDVAEVDLSEEGYGDFYWSEKDEDGAYIYDYDAPTVLKLFIYVQQVYYSAGTENFTAKGSPHGVFISGFFGMSDNLNYYVNGEYPLDPSLGNGMGATCDAIALEDGDLVEVAGFTELSFWNDSNSAFNYFIDEDSATAAAEGATLEKEALTLEYSARAGEALSVYAMHATGDISGDASTSYSLKEGLLVHFGSEYDPELFGDDTVDIRTDSNGKATIQIPEDTEPGVYLVWADGQYGADYATSSVVSAPAAARVVVYDDAEITTESLDTAYQDMEYSAEVEATGYPDATFSATGLPDGLSIDPDTGTISGTPTTAGVYKVTVTADNGYSTDQKTFSLEVSGDYIVPAVTTDSLDGAVTGMGYSAELEASGYPVDFSWSLADGSSLPEGLSLSSDGAISGIPATAGTYTFSVYVTSTAGTSEVKELSLVVEQGSEPSIGLESLEAAVPGEEYSADLGIGGCPDPEVTVTGLPDGLSYDDATGTINGTVEQSGIYEVTVTATNFFGTVEQTYELIVGVAPEIATGSLEDAALGAEYSASIEVTGDPAPEVTVTGLPGGLTYDAETGKISGTPSESGIFTVTVAASNIRGSVEETLELQVVAGPVIATDSLDPVELGAEYSVTLGISGYPDPEVTVMGLPDGLSYDAETGTINGTVEQSGTYEVTVTATNAYGTAEQTYELVAGVSPAISTTSLGSATVGNRYSASIEVSGDPDPEVEVTGLPDGLSYSSKTGLITGRATEYGEFEVTVTVSNALGTVEQAYALVVSSAPGIATEALGAATQGEDYSAAIEVTGYPVPEVTVTGLPDGLSYDAETGMVSGAATEYGTFEVTVVAANSLGAVEQTFELVVERPTAEQAVFARLYGGNRYATMQAIATAAYEGETSQYAVLATGESFPDALASASLAGILDAPIVLVSPSDPSAAISVLEELDVGYFYAVGGTASISDGSASAIAVATGAGWERVYGSGRQETAVAIAAEVQKITGGMVDSGELDAADVPDTAIVAAGANYPDALSASPYAYWSASPIYLAEDDGSISEEVLESIEKGGYENVLIVGGISSVSSTAYEALRAEGLVVTREAGGDRYGTSAAVAAWSVEQGMSYDGCAIAYGENFPDALAGATICGRNGSVMLLTGKDEVAGIDALAKEAPYISKVYFIGGTGSVPESVRTEVKAVFEDAGAEVVYDDLEIEG